jgi:hypothetical protein
MPATVAPTPTQDTSTPGALDVAAAALRQNNIVSSVSDRYFNNPDSTAPAVSGYNPYDNGGIAGFEDNADRFSRSTSPEQTQVIKNRITSENGDRQTIARAGWGGVAASMAAGVIDPISIAAMAIAPEVAGPSRLARIGTMIAANVGAGEAQAGALAANSETTKYTDNMGMRIGGNALLAGVFGTIATRVPKAEFSAMADKATTDLAAKPVIPAESTAGAAQVATTSLADESLASGGQTIGKYLGGQASPLTRIMTSSPSVEARRLAQQLADTPYILEKNMQGIATPSSIESRTIQSAGVRNYDLATSLDKGFADYKQGGGDLSRSEFSEEIANAMRNKDVSDVPQAQKIAQSTRQIFTADRAAFAEHGVMPEGTEVLGAPSYFPRAYDQNAIAANFSDFKQRLSDWYTQNPKLDENGLAVQREPGEVTAAVHDTLDKIQNTARGQVDLGQGIKNPNATKARALDVPDSILSPYLSSDFEHVMHNYHNTVVPQIEMRRAFGSTTMEPEFQRVTDEFHRLKEAAPNDAAIAKLNEQQKATLRDLDGLRERVLGQSGPKGNESVNMVRAAKPILALNYMRELGGMVLSAIPDVGRAVARYGLYNTSKRTAQFLTNFTANGLTRADAKRMGTALDWVLHTRAKSLGEIGDELGGSRMDHYLQNATSTFTKLSGMATYDASLRGIASSLEQDAIYRAITNGKLSAIERGKLAAHGIGTDDLPAIREQWQKFGSSEQGLNRARTELWTDKDAASKVEQAVVRAGQTVAFAVGKGDLPLMMNSPLAKMLLQFKSFSISSVNRLAIPVAQGLAHGDLKAVNGLGVMLALGGMSYVIKEELAGRKPDLSPGRLALEMADRSGVLGYLPDAWDASTRLTHLPSFSRFGDRSGAEAFAGPTYGTLGNVGMLLSKATALHQLSASDVHKFRQLMPYQNLWYFRNLVNALEGKTADALNAKGAKNKAFGDYFNPSQFDEPITAKPSQDHLLGDTDIPNAL